MELIRWFYPFFPKMLIYLTILFILPAIHSQQQQVPIQQQQQIHPGQVPQQVVFNFP